VGLVGDLLEKAARATPAAVEHRRTGWWLRYTDNVTWWSGAVLAHGAADDLGQRIDAAERFYAERDAIPRFQICPDCPGPLDQVLAGRGYRWDAAVLLVTAMAATPAGECAPAAATVRLDDSPGPEWLAVLRSATEPETDVEHETRLLHGIDRPQAYVTACMGSDPVGIGRAVVDEAWTGIFSMATAPRARRRGVGRLVLSALGRWAEGRGAPQLYLQVERANAGARRLYDAAGFTQLAAYHYRVREGSGAAECRGSGLHTS